jgi:uncharacterized protein (TIGR03067 family)
MKWSFAFVLLFIVVPLIADPPRPPDPKTDLKPLQGVWLISTVETDGMKVTVDEAKWVLEGDKYTTRIGTQVQEGTAKVEPSRDPKWIDLSVTVGNDKGQTYRGIYKVTDDELLLCFPRDTKADRPTELSGNAGNGQTLMVLKRKKA